MKFAARMNSFLTVEKDLLKIIKKFGEIEGMTDVELNYPEHFQEHSLDKIANVISEANLHFNGVAIRFRKDFLNGEFNSNENKEKAVLVAKNAIDVVRKLGGETITIWLEFDGNDYSFQIDYIHNWKNLVNGFQQICDYAKEIFVSIEFKPFEPRSYSLIPNTGFSLHFINQVNRKNMGMTLDYCHSLMANENPAFALAVATIENKLRGVHLNDGNGSMDDGMIFGSASVVKTLEFIFYLKRSNYEGLIYFDTFPVRIDPYWEAEMNIKMFNKYWDKIDEIGVENISKNILANNNHYGESFVFNHLI